MTDYIRETAEKLIAGNNVVLYGAGADAIYIILRLRHQYGVAPTCVCDSDTTKHHKKIEGIEILSLNETLTAYPDACFLISSRTYKYEIIGNLLGSGKISKERIINYEPVERRLGCRYLNNDVVVFNHGLNFCCSDFGKNKSPYVAFEGDYELTVKKFIALRDKLIDDLNNGVPTSCDGCPHVRTGYYAAQSKIRLYSYGEVGVCNYNCSYCRSLARHNMKIDENEIDCGKMLDAFERLGFTDDDFTIDIAPGEITVHPKKREIYDTIEKRCEIILTNASVYDERLAGILKKRGRFYISIDAGTKQTYAKVKGVDLFDKVRENLKRYSDTAGFAPYELKYIFMPEINDNEADVDGFAQFCKDVGTNHVLISYDFFAPAPKDETVLAVKRLLEKLDSNGISYNVVSDVISRIMTSDQV